ncbi:hypothetical protein BKH42_08835 [Helicobacter sp. 13S00482-2]|nr:hypothetical protein BKH42_08835 [Helicobacter sp. 13S00482-2]
MEGIVHTIVTSDWFSLTIGICSVISFFLAFRANKRITKINNQLSIKDQDISITGNNNITAGANNAIIR